MERARANTMMTALASLPPDANVTLELDPSTQEGHDTKIRMTKA